MAKMILIGLVEPTDPEQEDLFRERYLGNHIEDIANCPGFLSGTVYRLDKQHDAFPVISQYLTVYEIDAESAEEASDKLHAYIADPNAFPGRLPGGGALKIIGSGWYAFERAFHSRG
ncbi:MAG: hypothetical protein ACKVVT_07535 [Dehalococcoidia bacterium]